MRLPVVVVVLACVAGVAAAVAGAGSPLAAVNFLMPGHWVFNGDLQMAFHVDGSTGEVDARAGVPGDVGARVYQGDTSGYVVGDERITEFGKSSLEVESTSAVPSGEVAVGVEAAGGPYLVFREIGKIVRLGRDPVSIDVGGPVGLPVATRDGTVWLPRPSAGLLCELRPGASSTSCPVRLPAGDRGVMTVVDDRPVFVDTTTDVLHVVEPDRLGDGRALGVEVPDTVRVASTDVAGRVVLLAGNTMHLVDSGLGSAGVVGAPSTVALPPGDYDGPVSTGSAVALVDRASDLVVTFDSRGERRESQELPPENGDPRLTLGEDDRIYVDGAEGEHVLVVDEDGSVTDVPLIVDPQAPSPGLGSDGPQAPPVTDTPPDTPPVVAGPPVQDRVPPPDTEQRDPPRTTQQPPPAQPEQAPPPPPPVVPASPPGAPTAVTAVAGDTTATLTWGPAPDNRAPITGYTITWPGGSLPLGPVTTATIPGLTNNTNYTFTVTATNTAGTGPGATSTPITPTAPTGGPADAPTGLAPEFDPATREAVLTWTSSDLRGNELVHHAVSVTGEPAVHTTANVATFENVEASGTITFTVRTDTRTPGGEILQGAPASVTVEAPEGGGNPQLVLSRGPAAEEYRGEHDACAWMRIVITGLEPGREYSLTPHSTDPGYSNEGATIISEDGSVDTERFAYAGVGHTVWVRLVLPDGTVVESNELEWTAG